MLPLIVATKPKPSAPEAASEAPAPSFEEAMHRLEAIVETMESGDVPLADLLVKYEEGTRLLAHCESRLKSAELKIEQLKRQKDGKLAATPFAPSERAETGPA